MPPPLAPGTATPPLLIPRSTQVKAHPPHPYQGCVGGNLFCGPQSPHEPIMISPVVSEVTGKSTSELLGNGCRWIRKFKIPPPLSRRLFFFEFCDYFD